MAHNILLANWNDSSKAYEAFSKLKNENTLDVLQAVIIERKDDGKIEVKDGIDTTSGTNTIGGGLIGSLVGIIGGPLGVLLGFSTGALIGSVSDFDNTDQNQAVLSRISKSLPIDSTGLFINLNEADEELANAFFNKFDAVLLRWDFDTVSTEVEASVEAWEEAQRVANETLHEQKKEENKAKRQKKWQDFKAKFHH